MEKVENYFSSAIITEALIEAGNYFLCFNTFLIFPAWLKSHWLYTDMQLAVLKKALWHKVHEISCRTIRVWYEQNMELNKSDDIFMTINALFPTSYFCM